MKTLLYCPMLYHHDKGIWPPVLPSTSYFLQQKIFWDIFESLQEWEILWNSDLPNSNLYDPIQDWNSRNIQFTRMRIGKALKKCDKILVDVPSSVMWNAKKTNKPCLCLTFDSRWLRKDVSDEFDIRVIDHKNVENILKGWLDNKTGILYDSLVDLLNSLNL